MSDSVYWRSECQQWCYEVEIDGLLSTLCSAKCNNPTNNNISYINYDNNRLHQHEDIVGNTKCGTS